jgi:hypothetical protein
MNRKNASWGDAYLVHVAKITNLRHDCDFVTTNDTYVWKDTPNESAVTAVYKSDEDIAQTIPMEKVSHVSWTTVEVKPGFEARIKGKETVSYGETPGRAVSGLSFEDAYEINREPTTDSDTLEHQILDVLKRLDGAVNVNAIPNFLNYQNIDIDDIDVNSVREKLLEMEETTNAYRTRGEDPSWWSAR